MGNEYRAKVFKSGNSVALRLPKALGLKDGDEMLRFTECQRRLDDDSSIHRDPARVDQRADIAT